MHWSILAKADIPGYWTLLLPPGVRFSYLESVVTTRHLCLDKDIIKNVFPEGRLPHAIRIQICLIIVAHNHECVNWFSIHFFSLEMICACMCSQGKIRVSKVNQRRIKVKCFQIRHTIFTTGELYWSDCGIRLIHRQSAGWQSNDHRFNPACPACMCPSAQLGSTQDNENLWILKISRMRNPWLLKADPMANIRCLSGCPGQSYSQSQTLPVVN